MDPQPKAPRGPWHPDREWADPLIALLALLCVFIGMLQVNHKSLALQKPPEHVGLLGRVAEVQALGEKLRGDRGVSKSSLTKLQDRLEDPWDRALLSVLLAESGEPSKARHLALEGPLPAGAGAAFRKGWASAYQEGPALPPADRAAVMRALGGGYGARMLDAKWAEKEGRDGAKLRTEAQALAMGSLLLFAGMGISVLLLAMGGLAFAIMLIVTRKVPRRFAPATYSMSIRAALLVFLGWLNIQMLSGFVISPLVAALPFLKPVMLPLAYGIQAGVGVIFLCSAEGITFRQLLERVAPGAHSRSLAWGVGFLALAVGAVLLVALLMSPFMRATQPPQKELVDLVANTRGPFALPLLFITIALVAPCFEELMFRGFLLPVLGHQWKHLRFGSLFALLATSLLFGLIHLQPIALPVLTTLGIVLGLAVLRTGNLLTSILVHGLWNGGVFLLMRFVLA